MRRLANLLNIDVSAIQMMWLVYINDLSAEKEIREELEEQLSKYYKTRVIQSIDHCMIVLLGIAYITIMSLRLPLSILKRQIIFLNYRRSFIRQK